MLDGEQVSRATLGAAIVVHQELGPGLLESAYETCLAQELAFRGVPVRRQIPLPLVYRGAVLDCAYRIDLLVDETLVVEVKSVAQLLPIHEAQLMSYLRLSGKHVGLLINFNEPRLRDGVRRRVM